MDNPWAEPLGMNPGAAAGAAGHTTWATQNGQRVVWPLEPGAYEMGAEVGASKHAVVREARCSELKNQPVCIKIINLESLGDEKEVERLHAQTKLLSNMAHENVIKYHCSFVCKHELWIVMEYAACGSCELLMRDPRGGPPRPLREQHIATVLGAVVRGVEYLHTREHVHRDIKAANILVHADGRATIGDFACSRSLMETDGRTDPKTYVGTLQWMAPEVLEQTGRYDMQADIWSIGPRPARSLSDCAAVPRSRSSEMLTDVCSLLSPQG